MTDEMWMQLAWAFTWVEEILGPKKTQLWMYTHNPNFGDSPFMFIALGRGHKVLKFIENAYSENYFNDPGRV